MDLFWTLTLRATLLLGGILLANCFLRNTNPRWRILLCEAGSAALLLLPLILWWKPLTLDLPVMPPEPTGPVLEPIPIPTGEPIPLAAPEPTASAVPPMNSEPFPVQSDSEPRPKVSLTNTVAPWIYSFGLLTLLLFYLRRRQQLNRYLGRLSRPDRALQTQFDRLVGDFHLSRKPRCLLTRETVSPFCSGIFRPVVAIPDSLAAPADRETLEMVLRHELAHLENGDLLRTSWMNVVTLLFWFHPLIWFLRRNHAMALEELADRTAASDEPSGASYRTTLARLALLLRDVPAPPPGTVGIFGPPQILVR
ncbi:MAG: M56 family metallopeptidase, partial [Verrucomicrobiota bacterium]